MKKKIMKYKAEDLWEVVLTEQEINCSKCNKKSTLRNCDEMDACTIFFDDGWRKTKENCYCPKCAKEKLKINLINQ